MQLTVELISRMVREDPTFLGSSCTFIRRYSFSFVNDEHRWWFRMHNGKLDPSETSVERKEHWNMRNTPDVVIAHFSSSASFTMGIPVCMVCMRRTWLLLCLS
jgi:hypothetical protein